MAPSPRKSPFNGVLHPTWLVLVGWGALCFPVMHRLCTGGAEISRPPAGAACLAFPSLVVFLALAPPWALVLAAVVYASEAAISWAQGESTLLLYVISPAWAVPAAVLFYAIQAAICSACQ